MKVTLAKHGGLAAGMSRPPQVLDGATLPGPATAELARLVAAARAEPTPPEKGPGRVRDGMSYTITVEDGGRPTVLSQSDGARSPAFADLCQWLERHFAGR